MADRAGAQHSGLIRAGILPQILRSWRAPSAVARDLRGMPDRVQLALLMVAMLLFFIAQLPVHARAAELNPSIPLNARIAGAFFAVMFLLPPILYFLATVIAALSRILPRRVQPADSRLALFWALLAVSPAMLLAGLVKGFVGPGTALGLVQVVSALGFICIWGGALYALSERS